MIVKSEHPKKKRRKKVLIIAGSILALLGIGAGIFFGVMSYQINQIPKMTFEEMLAYTTKSNDNAVVSVGIIQDGKSSFNIYGNNGSKIEKTSHIFEIGSITKTFTVSLLYKAIEAGKANIDDPINLYLDLPAKKYYPTLKRIVSHTAGYKSHYLEWQMVSNFFKGRNDFYNIPQENLVNRIGQIDLKNQDYKYEYSNFGISVIGAVLSAIYKDEYSKIMNDYIKNDLNLKNTYISYGEGDLGKLWDWAENDAYLPAGGILSTMEDMLLYTRMQLSENPSYFGTMHKPLVQEIKTSSRNKKMNIHIDGAGAAWIMDDQNDIIWHNGGTGNYNSYIGFDKKKQIAVVILMNTSPSYRIPATVMGIKLLTDLQ